MTKPDRTDLDGADELEIEPRFVIRPIISHNIIPDGAIEVAAAHIIMTRRWIYGANEKVQLGYVEVDLEGNVATIRVNVCKGAKVMLIANGVKVNG